MTPKLAKMWIEERDGEQTIRADFDNDRHYAVSIFHPGGPDNIAQALFQLSGLIARDPHLRPNA